MKHLIITLLTSLIGTAAFAGSDIICKHEGFSDLTVSLQPGVGSSLLLTVLKDGRAGTFAPRMGETALLQIDEESSGRNYLILRSEYKAKENLRSYEMSILKQDLGKSLFRAALRASQELGDSTFVSYDMVCTRE